MDIGQFDIINPLDGMIGKTLHGPMHRFTFTADRQPAIDKAMSITDRLVFLDILVDEKEHVYPMQIKHGGIDEMWLRKGEYARATAAALLSSTNKALVAWVKHANDLFKLAC